MRWTEEQDAYVLEHAHKGAAQVAKDMQSLFDVRRSAQAVERHGLRIGASFRKWEVCPQCGETVHKLKRAGVCEACNWKNLAENQRKVRRNLERVRLAKQEYNTEQQRTRRYVDSLDLSGNLSECLVS